MLFLDILNSSIKEISDEERTLIFSGYKIEVNYSDPNSVCDDPFFSINNLSCFPNPANNLITIQYKLNTPSKVNFSITNSLGEKVETLIDNTIQANGEHMINYRLNYLLSGLYFINMTINGRTYTKNFIVNR